jgi:hypothetical protein
MSDAIDYIALQKSRAIQYMVAQIMDESYQNNLTPCQTVELAIKRGMEYQDNLDHINKWSGYPECNDFHPPKDPPRDEHGYPWYGITTPFRN